MMKAALYHGAGDVRIEQVDEPGPVGPNDVLLQMRMGALCGTDASAFQLASSIPLKHRHPDSRHRGPVILGHEMVGVVIARGSEVNTVHIGQRVVPGAGMWCGICPRCQEGRTNICERYYLYGIHANGGFAEFATFPAKMCVPVPDACRDEAAAMAQPCAVALHALSRVPILPGQTIALFGVGNIGSLLLACLQTQMTGDGKVIVVDIEENRLDTAMKLGADIPIDARTTDPVGAIRGLTDGHGVDIAIEATGTPASILQAFACVRRGGLLLQVGIPLGPVCLSLGLAVEQEKGIVTTNGQINAVDLPRALHLLATTDLATRIGYTVISLDDLVTQGLRPLVEHTTKKKVLVRIS